MHDTAEGVTVAQMGRGDEIGQAVAGQELMFNRRALLSKSQVSKLHLEQAQRQRRWLQLLQESEDLEVDLHRIEIEERVEEYLQLDYNNDQIRNSLYKLLSDRAMRYSWSEAQHGVLLRCLYHLVGDWEQGNG